MKKEKNSKKGKENLVGKIIYSFLLFAPLLSILATCVYTIINENAYNSYSGNEINERDQLNVGNQNTNTTTTYYLNVSLLNNANDENIYVDNFVIYNRGGLSDSQYNALTTNAEVIFRIRNKPQNNVIDIYKLEEETQTYVTNVAYNTNAIFTFNTDTPHNTITEQLYYYQENPNHYLDNVFEYSIYKIENNDLYNWSKTTGTYTVVRNTAQLLGITNTFIPMLLTYWLIISIIYIIYDIGLIMIWIAHNKVHELLESV